MEKKFKFAYLKIVILSLGFVFVIALINKLQSGLLVDKSKDPSSAWGLLLGGGDMENVKPFNWCPAELKQVKITFGEKQVTLNTLADMVRVCELLVKEVSSPADSFDFTEGIVAVGKKSLNSETLSLAKTKEGKFIYKAQNMLFTSKNLDTIWHEYFTDAPRSNSE